MSVDAARPPLEPVFNEPWEARAFALIVAMSQAGHFTWGQWVESLANEIAQAKAIEAAGGKPASYYEQWQAAAEKLMIDKGMTSVDQLRARRFAIAVSGPTHVLKSG
jgi:nitrile hydratase accessory protein